MESPLFYGMMRSAFLFVAAFAVSSAAACGSRTIVGDLSVTNAVYIIPASDGPAAVYFTVHNPTATPDALLAVSSPSLNNISLHETMRLGDSASAMIHMSPVARVVVPAHGDLTFAPGRYHAMASGVASPLVNGTAITLTMTFATHAPIVTSARVLTYADYDPRATESKR
jgi:copper(I)-binding protein